MNKKIEGGEASSHSESKRPIWSVDRDRESMQEIIT